MAREDRYFSRSWALLTRDKGWQKPLLVLSVAQFVPIAGQLGLSGYALEWSRLTAWGVDASPKQKGVRVGECIASGWRGFLASLGYVLVVWLLQAGLQRLFPNSVLVSLLVLAISFFMGVVYTVVRLRATIYQRVGAGYKVSRIWDMVSRDPLGLLKIAGIMLLVGLVGGLVIGLVAVVGAIPFVSQIALSAYGINAYSYSNSDLARLFVALLARSAGSIAIWLVVVGFLAAVLVVFSTLVEQTAVGLWMRQFDVPAWGASDDPLPTRPSLPDVPSAAPYVPVAPTDAAPSAAPATESVSSAAPVSAPEFSPEPVVPTTPYPSPAAPDASPTPAAPASPEPASPGVELAEPAASWPDAAPVPSYENAPLSDEPGVSQDDLRHDVPPSTFVPVESVDVAPPEAAPVAASDMAVDPLAYEPSPISEQGFSGVEGGVPDADGDASTEGERPYGA